MSTAASQIECPECGARNVLTDAFCASCGLKLPRRRAARADAELAPHDATQEGGTAPPRRLRQREENRYVGKSRGTLSAIRGLYGLFAFLTVVPTFFAWVDYLGSSQHTGLAFALITLATITAAINVAGFVLFPSNPFLWTVVLAALQTLSVTVNVFATESWDSATISILSLQGLLVIALWCAVPVTARVTKIMRERAEEVAAKGREAKLSSRVMVRDASEQRRTTKRLAIGGVALCALVLVGAWLPFRSSDRSSETRQVDAAESYEDAQFQRDTRADELEDTAAAFRDAWGRSDLDGVKGYFEVERQTTFWPKVIELIERRGWQEELPSLGAAEVSDQGRDNFDVYYRVSDEERLKTRWSYIEGGWRIVRFAFSKL